MAYVIYTENLHDQVFMDRYCLGFDSNHMPEGYEEEESYTAYLLGERDGIPKTTKWAAEIAGVNQETITRFVREYAGNKPVALV